MKHTPGPWFVEEEEDVVISGTFAISDDHSTFIAHVESWGKSDKEVQKEARANAILIAASPDMLAALKEADEIILKATGRRSFAVKVAIAKAERG